MGLRARFGHAADSPHAPISYRRSLGLGWLIGLVVIPLLIAAIGYGALERSRAAPGPARAAPPVASSGRPGKPPLSLAPLSIVRTGNDVTLTGEFPDDSAKAVLTRVLKTALPADGDIIDQIGINPNVDALDFSNAGPIFTNSASITNFNLTVDGNTITLTGTAASQDQKNTIDSDAAHTWSNLTVVDQLAVDGTPPPPPPAGQCGDLQSDINAVTGGLITFGNDGFSLTPADDRMLTQVADKLKACPNAHATINGYTDNSGTEAVNIPLSDSRAQMVTNCLVAQGVTSNRLTVRGLGSINPVAGNDTADGRAKNRRVEIVVG
ncbi:channel-forming protein ArfA/OmpATb [Mycobacterium stomatepiae]|uniref:Peptidoglycan-binding protein ArfA n=1 Tax=Mycobacterium stomatepiae TaxID=470076 RepID=A0A7I7QEB7_9MYCO|nr:OmpA family protein [Mycobacterium stomatepiae]BBY24673.1 peptidoglycan-binding protein ArfA [Mycobacterium stomatepiae]